MEDVPIWYLNSNEPFKKKNDFFFKSGQKPHFFSQTWSNMKQLSGKDSSHTNKASESFDVTFVKRYLKAENIFQIGKGYPLQLFWGPEIICHE